MSSMKIKNVLRSFIALWYLLGWISHVYLGLFNPQLYAGFGNTALIPGYAQLWNTLIMPNIAFFALLLAVFEIAVGVLLTNRGKWVKYGLVLSILFNLFLVQMGLSMPAAGFWQDFAGNRLPNLIFIALQIPLFWGEYPRTIWQMIFKPGKG